MAEPVPPRMPTVCPDGMCSSISERAYLRASGLYLNETPQKSMLPSAISFTAPGGDVRATGSSSTSPMRLALASERVSSRNTFDIIISEFITCIT